MLVAGLIMRAESRVSLFAYTHSTALGFSYVQVNEFCNWRYPWIHSFILQRHESAWISAAKRCGHGWLSASLHIAWLKSRRKELGIALAGSPWEFQQETLSKSLYLLHIQWNMCKE